MFVTQGMNAPTGKSAYVQARAAGKRVLGILLVVILLSSCAKKEQPFDTAWSPAEAFSSSREALNSTFGIQKMNGAPVCVDGNDYYFLGNNGTNWIKKTFPPPEGVGDSFLLMDPASTRFVFYKGAARDGKLDGTFVFCTLNQMQRIDHIINRSVSYDSKTLFAEIKKPTDEAVEKFWRQQYGPPRLEAWGGGLGGSVVVGADVYFTYSVQCGAFYGADHMINLPVGQAGLLHSAGDHSRWKRIKLLGAYSLNPSVFATRSNLYFLATAYGGLDNMPRGLWSIQMSHEVDAHSKPENLAPNICGTIHGRYLAVTDNETIHLIWLDARHQRHHNLRSMLTGGQNVEENLEIYYRSRNDASSGWTKEIFLSKGLDFVFAPDMAVDGQNIVVVWAGYQGDKGKPGSEFHPSDIYFTTSRDGGATWTPATRVTNNAKSGVATGRPLVALHKGVIHLFYIQGNIVDRSVGGGLRLLNQDPWPIIYQRRVFPN